ncbi:hypothetical protein [Streptomyces sp. NPDC094149]|uniref:hypothetical protein n=1 Tax=Streptomyces sp. NPDC094149 TaxID=3155079 RepID=UPI0033330032
MTTAEDVRANLNAKAERINAQRNLAPHVKQTMIARAYLEAHQQLAELKDAETRSVQRERKQLERKLFGNAGLTLDPQAAVSRRDAADRAARIDTADEALRVMQRADRDGDTTLAKAIASRAADYSGDPVWAKVVHAYVAERPSDAETLDAMQQLPNTEDGVWKLQQAMRYGVLPPSGVEGMDHYQLQAAASRPLDGDQAA